MGGFEAVTSADRVEDVGVLVMIAQSVVARACRLLGAGVDGQQGHEHLVQRTIARSASELDVEMAGRDRGLDLQRIVERGLHGGYGIGFLHGRRKFGDAGLDGDAGVEEFDGRGEVDGHVVRVVEDAAVDRFADVGARAVLELDRTRSFEPAQCLPDGGHGDFEAGGENLGRGQGLPGLEVLGADGVDDFASEAFDESDGGRHGALLQVFKSSNHFGTNVSTVTSGWTSVSVRLWCQGGA